MLISRQAKTNAKAGIEPQSQISSGLKFRCGQVFQDRNDSGHS